MKNKVINKLVSECSSDIQIAANTIRSGGVVGYLTDTLYGIGADATNAEAVNKVFNIKDRSKTKPLLVLVDNYSAALDIAKFDIRAEKLAKIFWPGPLTLILPRKSGCIVCKDVNPLDDSISLRIPKRNKTCELIAAAKVPITAPSANLSGHQPANSGAELAKALGKRLDLIIDGGQSRTGLPSTILDLKGTTAKIIRNGAIPTNDIFDAIN